jgi:hypothetical protein
LYDRLDGQGQSMTCLLSAAWNAAGKTDGVNGSVATAARWRAPRGKGDLSACACSLLPKPAQWSRVPFTGFAMLRRLPLRGAEACARGCGQLIWSELICSV